MKLLELGYTTIRDCGDNSCRGTVALSRSIEAGRLVGPTIIPCCLILCPTAPSTSDGLAECIDGVDNTRQMARRALLKGAKFLKLYGSASMMAPTKETGYPIIEPEEIREAVKVAENYSTYVSIHSHGARAMDQAIRAGVHTVEHASLISEETLQYIDENRKDFGIVPARCPAIPTSTPRSRPAQGKNADLIVVSGDPVEDITVMYSSPEHVIKGGRLIR